MIAGVSDPHTVIASLKLGVPESETVRRTVWQYKDADWDRLRDALIEADWSFIDSVGTSEAAQNLTDIILEHAHECIPERQLEEKKSSHPWLTARAVEAVRAKHEARGSPDEVEANEMCSQILLEEHSAFAEKTRDKLQGLPRGSKRWWTKSKQLMGTKKSATSIPALKQADGTWVMDSEAKATHFADAFARKCVMIDEEAGPYSDIIVASHEQKMLDCSPCRNSQRGLYELSRRTAPLGPIWCRPES